MSVNHKILLSCLAHFYIRPLGALGRPAISVRVPGCQKLQMTA